MKYMFGDKIREVREKKKITMKEVAEKAGVSESLISQIERNRVSPAIDTLLSITDVLDLDLEYLFSGYKKEKKVHLVKQEARNKILLNGVTYEQLSRTANPQTQEGIEAYYLVIPPGMEKGNTDYGHTGSELGIILEGQGTFKIGTSVYDLGAGDSLSFGSEVPHVLKNTGQVPLKAYWIVTPPKMFFSDEGK